jgi:poly(3-hydroxybutyrate) depolymerase
MFLQAFLGLAATAATCLGASLQPVSDFGNNPTNIQMNIYVPDKLASNPAVIVAVSIIPIPTRPPSAPR